MNATIDIGRLWDGLLVLVRPSYWLQNNPLSLEWDAELRWLLENGYQFEYINDFEARIGEYVVWIENHPYASFTYQRLRPHRVTILRAWRVLRASRRAHMAALFPNRNRRAIVASERRTIDGP